jgi:hypothetical protein
MAAVALSTVAAVTGRELVADLITASGLVVEITGGVSGTALADIAAIPACLNSTDFK